MSLMASRARGLFSSLPQRARLGDTVYTKRGFILYREMVAYQIDTKTFFSALSSISGIILFGDFYCHLECIWRYITPMVEEKKSDTSIRNWVHFYLTSEAGLKVRAVESIYLKKVHRPDTFILFIARIGFFFPRHPLYNTIYMCLYINCISIKNGTCLNTWVNSI